MKTKTKTMNWRTSFAINRHQAPLQFNWSLKVFTFLFLTFSMSLSSFGQTMKRLSAEDSQMQEMTERQSPDGWLQFNSKTVLRRGDLVTKHKASLGLGSKDAMGIVSESTDQLGKTRVKYQQSHNGVPVEDGELIVHIDDDCIEYLASGAVVKNLNLSTRARIKASRAFQLAKEATRSNSFAWENEEMEAELKEETGNPRATYLPKPEMIITSKFGVAERSRTYYYVYRYMMQTVEPYQLLQVDINASNGSVINMFDTVIECFKSDNHKHGATCNHDHEKAEAKHLGPLAAPVEEDYFFANGSAPLIYYGTKTIQTKWRGWPWKYYHLKDESRGSGIETKKYGSGSKITDKDNTWPSNQGAYTQAHWTCGASWDYFKNVHGLNGTNGNGKKIKVRSNWNASNANYSNGWFSQTINIGINSGNHLSTMDIMAHEYAHGVTRHSADLKYQGESGALNESFSDIFGTMAEDYHNTGSFDWTMGEDASWTIRSLSNPPAHGHPDTYGGTNWVNPNSSYDYGGVHINSGVQNKWFYLLSQGGTHNGVTVQGIGRSKAAKIAFRNLTVYLGKNSNFQDARTGGIQSAIDLYGKCSFEEIQTTNAWAAVNVGPQFVGDCVKILGPTFICIDMLPRTFTAKGLAGDTFTWSQIPSSWNVTISGTGNKTLKLNSVNIPNSQLPKSFVIKLTSSSGGTDTHYVTIDDCSFDPCDEFMRER